MKITRLEECAKTAVTMAGANGASRQLPIGMVDGAPNFSIRVFTLEPGGHTPHHSHESEHLNYVLEGEGVALEGETPRAIKAGDFILIKPHELHQYRNTGPRPLAFMCMVPSAYE
ncbi:cupin domain-containing protein [Geopsychrobacter electrodiphilus]|uniref:cupin domain-containing protein n=1 Tax=Geopsychrobacter electrodiphilus TaxID=225196 RepID=UPI000368F98A|nr:cupin domain-containing protein [Geopsychrobacter electrodiphilus]